MKIVYVTGNFLPDIGGSEIVIHNLALLQQQLFGHDVTILTRWPLWRYMHKRVPYRMLPFFPKTFSLVPTPKSSRWRFKVASTQVLFYQKLFNFDLWHMHTLYTHTFLTMMALEKSDVATVLTCHGPDIFYDPARNYGQRTDPIINGLVNKILPKFDHIIAISNSMRMELEKCGGQHTKITLLPNGVDIKRIQETPFVEADLRKELSIPNDHKILLSVGSSNPVKGFDLIPSIIKRLHDTRHDFTWILIGKNSDEIRSRAEEVGVASSLRTLPATSNVFTQQGWELPSTSLVQLYKLADVYVSTSRSEALPTVLLEAMAVGLPIAAANATGVRDIVTPSLGLLSEIDNVDNLAASIIQIISNPELALKFHENALLECQRYSWSTVASQHNDLYSSLITK